MDGRTSALLILSLTLACCGCVTTHEKKVVVRTDGEAAPTVPGKKEPAPKPAPPRLVVKMAETFEKQADATENPEEKARLRDGARQGYQDVLKFEPNNLDAFRGLARVYIQMNDWDRALDTYKKALAKNPKELLLWHDLAMCHNRRKEWNDAAKCLQQALALDPENQQCLKTLGFTLARAGKYDQSVPYLTRAMGSAAQAHVQVARMLVHMGQREQVAQRPQLEEQARRHLRQALDESPNLASARELMAALDGTGGTRGNIEIQFSETH